MGDKTTITVDESVHSRFKSLKEDLNEKQDAPDHTSSSFLSALLDTWDAVDEGHYQETEAELIAEQLKDEIDSLAFDGAVFDEEAERIMDRIEELESRIPKKTADEMEGRLR